MRKKFKNNCEYFLLIFFYFLSKMIGLKKSSLLGGMFLSIYGIFSSKNKIAMKNLNKVFPNKSLKEKKIIIKKMWSHFGRVIGEYPHLNHIKALNNKYIKIEGIENLLLPLKKNRNCLFFSAHLGNWELTSHPLIESGYKISFIYRSPNNKKVDKLLRKIRLNYGVDLIRKGSVGAKKCIKLLKEEKGNIGMLIDQKMNDGVETIFFGYKTMTASAIAKFSIKYKCPIIPSVCKRNDNINFVIKYLPEISYEKVKELGTETKVMNLLNNYVESWIKESPEQWIWIHNRW